VPDIEPIESQLENNNVRDGGLGSLCWARWEVNRQILRLGSSNVEKPGGAEEGARVVATLRDELPTIEAELALLRNRISPELRPFAIQLASDVSRARDLVQEHGDLQLVLEALERQFVFDSYPQVDEYRMLAAEHPACAHL
jgi:hypothetical protein